ncbi:hypothetical protein QOL99_09105 [Deinococcus sp. MIMF12]|uniref:Uncharacterized protein n=1 Tax=Deinococcus rhizophilus TaxID=3049544 RepID=A0ABT7JGW7_9DEIO|nr:hypothetical protein [Deinococcus rhizophilus]MDL2344309.1 hypothetical protein [Deinococcus rhizophilus]
MRKLASTVCGPAVSARATARMVPARSTTVAATLYPRPAQFCTVSWATRRAAARLRLAWGTVAVVASCTGWGAG